MKQLIGETTVNTFHVSQKFLLEGQSGSYNPFLGARFSRKGQVKLDVKRAFLGLWLNPYRTRCALVFARGLKTREKF